jgi:hypothetical protein
MEPELHLRIAGAMQLLLALAHVDFPRRFGWREEFARISLLGRQVFYVHMLFLCIVLAMFGALSLFATDALLEPTRLSRLVLLGIAAFWALRLYCQWFVYDPSLWRGQRVRTVIHFVFTGLWAYLTAVYALAAAAV